MRKRVADTVIECVPGDITEQPGFSAIVNAANAQQRPGGGVAGAIRYVIHCLGPVNGMQHGRPARADRPRCPAAQPRWLRIRASG